MNKPTPKYQEEYSVKLPTQTWSAHQGGAFFSLRMILAVRGYKAYKAMLRQVHRAITGLDTLAASQVLGKLHHQYQLLVKVGDGPSTYYELSAPHELPLFAAASDEGLCSNASDPVANRGDLAANRGDLGSNTGDFPSDLLALINQLTPKARRNNLWPVILWLCAMRPYKTEQLAKTLNRRENVLKASHLNIMREQEGLIGYAYPEVPNHPEQAYQTTEKGRQWLAAQGIEFND
ncbi:hypothetical protein [Aeromonas veronii]|uniref:hypothetical protein n=1 Tax=Aeromonas veronii TaxID=654 RepID=UPI001C5A8CE9|nr:hypothetical protein [Aeromonas veronii]